MKFQVKLCFALLFALIINNSAIAQTITVKFSVDMKYQIADGTFNTSNNKVYLRGDFNSWDLSNQMAHQGDGVYVITLNLNANAYYNYKYYTDAPGFSNGGYEKSVGVDMDNRCMSLGTNSLGLAKIYFNNANLSIRKSTAHFNIWSAESDLQNTDRAASYLEDNYPRITGALESTIGQKINIWIYPDQKTYFVYKGYPDSPSWSVGGAVGKKDVLLFSPTYMGWDTFLSTELHEFTHIAVAWKMAIRVPSWLNEGCATFYSDDPPTRPLGSILDIVNNILGGAKPTLAYIEQDSFGDGNGYPLSFSIADFVFTKFGAHKLADFAVNVDYSVLGYNTKEEFQSGWHAFLDEYYLAPEVTVKFSVDMSYYISKGWFNPNTDKVNFGANFTNWYAFNAINEGNGIYSFTTFSPCNKEWQYKFKINTAGASNQGWEENVGTGSNGSRVLRLTNQSISTSAMPFNNLNTSLNLTSPNGGESLIAGDTASINWKYTSIPNIKVEFSSNNGTDWSTISSSYSASSCSISWLVPNITTSSAKIRIVAVSDNSITDESDATFKIVQPNNAGGPYIKDAGTVLLMHFENDYVNVSSLSNSGTPNTSAVSFVPSGLNDLNKALKVDNSQGRACITVPDYPGINLTGNWTIEFWFCTNRVGAGNYAYPVLLYKGNSPFVADYIISLSSDGKTISGEYTNTAGVVKRVYCGSLQTGVWYHAAFIKNMSAKKLSLTIRNTGRNIVSSANINDDAVPKNTPYGITIGGLTGGSNMNFDGMIDEVRISNSIRDFTVGIEDENRDRTIPKDYTLMQNYPNPFNPSTKIRFSLPQSSFTRLAVYDILGKELVTLVNGELSAGQHEVEFNAAHLASGIYFYRITSGRFTACKKLMLLK